MRAPTRCSARRVSATSDRCQHVAGFRARHVAELDELLEWYESHGVPCRFECCDDGAVELLAARGAVEAGPIDLLVGAPVVRAVDPTIVVEEVTPARADEFAALLLAGHEVADPSAPHLGALASFVSSSGMRCWIGSDGGTAVGACAFIVDDGVGFLANAATAPAGRGRGVQTALISTRIAAAVDAGCDLVATLAIPDKPSHRNLMRAGLQPVEHRTMLHVG